MPRLDDWSFRFFRLVGPYALRWFPGMKLHRTVTLPDDGAPGHRRVRSSLTVPLQVAVHLAGCGRLLVISGRDAACLFDERSPAVGRKQVLFVPGCDHGFTSDEHDALLEETVVRAVQGGDILATVPTSRRGGPAS